MANVAGGKLYEIGVTRDAAGHIDGFSGEATVFADADNNDGGVAYGPGGVLFLARYPLNELGQTKPGSSGTDKVIELTDHQIGGSLGALAFVPAGLPGAGSLKLASYIGGQWYDADVVEDGSGTYDLADVTPVEGAVLSGPEGIAYVNPGSPAFGAPSVLVSEYGSGRVSAFEVGGDGDPVVSTRRDFVTGLSGAEGAFVDPVTGDYLFSTYGGGNRVIVVSGFARAATVSVVTRVVNDDFGTLSPGDFTVHVRRGGEEVDGSPKPGAADGIQYTLTADVEHTVQADPVPRYTLSYSEDCADGRVTPQEGVARTCVVTADDAAPTATLRVVTEVEGGVWQPQDFTVHVGEQGVELAGSPRAGSGSGDRFPAFAGTYTVAADAARGYAVTLGGACAADGSVTLEDGETKTCTITQRAIPLGGGLVVDGYGPTRTDGDWGIAEPSLSGMRGHLVDPANFGPDGTVKRLLRPAPGVREANERTLAGVDVFFTGWVATNSYTAAEKAALRDFVRRGGTLIATTDDTGHTMADAFGLTQGDGIGNPMPNTITDAAHPVADGPFGTVRAYDQYMATGHYPVLGDAHEIGRNDQGTSLAVIERGTLGEGSGAVIFVADVDVFSDFGGADVNATLIKNVFAFATEPQRPVLQVITSVVNDSGGSAAAGDFSVHLQRDGADVDGSPAAGVAGPEGRVYELEPGSYVVSGGEGPAGYTVSGGCSVTLALGERRTCTVTANDVAPRLTVRMQVVNDSGGTVPASGFTLHVRRDGSDVAGSPQPGSESGATYTLPAGVHVVSADAVARYGTAISGDCAADGSIALRVGDTRSCTVTADDVFQPPQGGQQLPPPEAGETVNALPKSGRVRIKLRGSNRFVDLEEGRQIPVGSVVDTTDGRVTLVAAGGQSMDFFGGIFRIGQTDAAKPLTTLTLVQALNCPKAADAVAAAKRKKRRLWGDGNGRFRTKGKHSAATVIGTRYLVEDRCASTLTKVQRGRVSVRDFVKRRTVTVRAGKQYVARARA